MIMYQAWIVQDFNGDPYNVILGEKFATTEDALEAVKTYESVFGKCGTAHIAPAGTLIKCAPVKHESLLQTILKWFS